MRPERVLYTMTYNRCLNQLLDNMRAANKVVRELTASGSNGRVSDKLRDARLHQTSCRDAIMALRAPVIKFLTDAIANPQLSQPSSAAASSTAATAVTTPVADTEVNDIMNLYGMLADFASVVLDYDVTTATTSSVVSDNGMDSGSARASALRALFIYLLISI
jgi:hypothetical protein